MSRTLSTRHLVRGLAGMVVGGLCGLGMGRLARVLGAPRGVFVWADDLALMTATTLIAGAVYLALLAADRRRLARVLECDTDFPATRSEVGLFRAQAAVLALAGVLLAAPPLLEHVARARREVGVATLAAVVLLFAFQTLLNREVWRRSDELLRGAVVQAGALAFWLGQGLLFLWAAAEKLSLAPPLSAWEVMMGLFGLYLVASAALSLRLRPTGGAAFGREVGA